MAVVSMKQLLEAGVHFGHQTRRWNPKMAKYIFTERNGIYIIDLQKTVKKLDEAYNFVRETVANGGDILFVGTKKQAQESIRDEANRCGMHYVNARWLGGMLTNFRTIRKRIDRMDQLKTMQEDGTFDLLPKKEVVKLELEMSKLEKYLGGVKNMKGLPKAMFIVDPTRSASLWPRPASCTSPSSPLSIPTAIPTRSITSSRQRRRHPRCQADLRRHGRRCPGGQAGRPGQRRGGPRPGAGRGLSHPRPNAIHMNF